MLVNEGQDWYALSCRQVMDSFMAKDEPPVERCPGCEDEAEWQAANGQHEPAGSPCRFCNGVGNVQIDDGMARRCDYCAGTGIGPHVPPAPGG